MYEWGITLGVAAAFIALAVFANRQANTPRKDMRPHQVPWHLIMVFSIFALFLVAVHIFNLMGFETGPEHAVFGRMR